MHLKPIVIASLAVIASASLNRKDNLRPRSIATGSTNATSSTTFSRSSRPHATKSASKSSANGRSTTITSSAGTTPSASKSTSESLTATSTHSAVRTDYSALCKQGSITTEMWDQFSMDTWLGYLANEMPNTGITAMDYMRNITPALNAFECNPGEECTLQADGAGCTTAEPNLTPIYWAIDWSIYNFILWINIMDSAILNAQIDFATTQDLLTSFVSENYGEPASSTWENSAISGSLSALSAFITLATTFVAGPLGAAVDGLKLIGGLASLGSAGATIGTGVLGAIIHQSVEIMETELRTAATAAEYVNQTVTSMRLAVIGMANNALYSPAYNPPVVSDYYYQNHTGIFSWIQGGVFAQEPPSSTEFKFTAVVLLAIYAIAISNMWTAQFVYFVNASDLWDSSSGTTFANMSISHNDMSRTVIGKDTIIAIKHTDGAAPDQPYDAVPGVNVLGQLSLSLAMMYQSSAWAQTTGKGFNRTWTGSESVKALTGYDGDDLDINNNYTNGPPNGIFANIPVCHLKGLIIQGRDKWGENLCDDECQFKRIVNGACPGQTVTLSNGTVQKFPIKLYDYDWNPKQ